MSHHDPRCPSARWYQSSFVSCQCVLIAQVESDTREQIAQTWQTRDWPLLTKYFNTGNVVGAAQAVTDWLRNG